MVPPRASWVEYDVRHLREFSVGCILRSRQGHTCLALHGVYLPVVLLLSAGGKKAALILWFGRSDGLMKPPETKPSHHVEGTRFFVSGLPLQTSPPPSISLAFSLPLSVSLPLEYINLSVFVKCLVGSNILRYLPANIILGVLFSLEPTLCMFCCRSSSVCTMSIVSPWI